MLKTIAVISDIHGNKPALEAVLRDIDGRGADLLVNLGDSLFGPVDPLGTAALLMARPDMINIMGNCDEHLLRSQSDSLTYRQVKPLLGAAEAAWLRGHCRSWSGEGMLMCHGTPWNNAAYLLEEVVAGGARYKQPEQLTVELHTIEERLILCGHSHVYHELALPDGKRVINAGSVGLPAYEEEEPYFHVMESGTPQASYCLCTRSGQDAWWTAAQILVEYDWELAACAAERNDREDYAVAIRTGRMQRPGRLL